MCNRAICLLALAAAVAATGAVADQPAALDSMANMHSPGIHHNFVLETDLSRREGIDTGTWDLDGWAGGDMNKLWLKSEGEISGGKTQRAEAWALFSRNVAAYWDAQAGIRYDAKPDLPGARAHTYLAAGVTGLAPYFLETQAHLFVRDDGAISGRLREETEWLLTQRLIMKPRLEVDLDTRKDPVAGLGTGITDASLDLQTRYEIRREVAPYVDLSYRQRYGATARYARLRGEKPAETRLGLGIRWMF
jgi:copper resistance protein B